ncbi:MAG: peptide-methionine (R)-S-oxide reductase [Pseudomonadales bacterium]|jgi:peptide-methionine (R)-S-oxide reductase
MTKIDKTEQDWRAELSSDDYHVCREGGTERAFTGEYVDTKTPGQYLCKCCAEPLFDSDTKYDSGSGWPSFYQPLESEAVTSVSDASLGMTRVEVRCAKCDSHLGHVFEDGPQPTGLRFCINSASLKLDEL